MQRVWMRNIYVMCKLDLLNITLYYNNDIYYV